MATLAMQFSRKLLSFRLFTRYKSKFSFRNVKFSGMAATDFKTLSSIGVKEFLDSFDTVLTDCDGVLWMYMNPLPHSAEVLNAFRSLRKKVFYVTNNSTKTREGFVEKCKTLNFEAAKEDILCTANLAACYLQDLGFNRKVYIVGSEAMGKELEKVGIQHCGVGPDPVNSNVRYNAFKKDPEVGAVVVGFDEHFSYPKMVKAATYLDDPNILFVATNTDERFPVNDSIVIPGTGCFVRCIENCAERKAVIMGKPERYIADVLKERFKVNPERTLMIGDRHNTDILLGTRCGFKTLLVLTGETKLEDVNRWKKSECPEEKDFIPDYYVDALGDLLPYLEKFKASSSCKMTSKHLTSLSKEEFQNFIDSIDVVLSDCDGVLWRETEGVPGSPEAVDKLKQLGKRFIYVTNNNTKTRSEFVEKCKGLNYKATVDEIICTSFLAAVYLKEKKFDKKAYIVGNIGIARELEAEGIKYCDIGPDDMSGDELDVILKFKPDPDVGAVIVGFDRYFGYPKLVKAATYLADPNVHFLGTNCDTERPSPNSNKFPGTGCFVKAIEAASDRKPVMLGKPGSFLIEYVIQKFGLNPQRTLMIGDNRTTDILFGNRCGFKTLLVLTGVTSKSDVDAMNASNTDSADLGRPDYYTDQLGDVLKMLPS